MNRTRIAREREREEEEETLGDVEQKPWKKFGVGETNR